MKFFLTFVLLLWAWPAQAVVTLTAEGALSGTVATTINIPYPAGLAAGDLLVTCLGYKYPATSTITEPGSPWVIPSNNHSTGGSGADAVDTGSTGFYVWYKEADGSETGSLSISVASPNVTVGQMYLFTKTGGYTWSVVASQGGENTPTNPWTVIGNIDPGMTSNDVVLACNITNTDSYTYSGNVLTQSGITYGAFTTQETTNSSLGDDIHFLTGYSTVTSGTSGGVATFTSTASTVSTNRPAGSGIILRIREVAGGVSSARRNTTLHVGN